MNRIILLSILVLVLASSQKFAVSVSPRVSFEGNYLTNNPKIPNLKV